MYLSYWFAWTINMKKLKCFSTFSQTTALAKQSKVTRHIMSRKMTTTVRRPVGETAGNTFMTYVKGAKDLKEYIEWISKLVVDVSHELQRDLKEEKATVQRVQLCRGGPDFSAEMCAIAHRDLVYQMTELPQSSDFLQTTRIMLSSIQQLENIRKMLVTNKQQKKTAIRKIRKIINIERRSAAGARARAEAAAEMNVHYGFMDIGEEDDDVMMVELEPRAPEESQTIKEMYRLIETVKQDHRTISKRLIEHQVRPIMIALRTRHVLAFKLAAENTICEIIHHAEKCRGFMLRCRWLALVEFCASSWWFETQKDPMDHSYYHVSAVIVGEEHEYKRFNPKKHYPVFIEQITNAEIRIVVAGVHDTQNTVEQFDLTSELLETILTEDAINAFENEQNELLIQQLQQEHMEA